MFIERFGAPLLISFVKAKNMKAAREGMKNIITQTAFTLEKEDKIEMMEPKKEGKVFNMMISYCDDNISKGILQSMLFGSQSEGSSSDADVDFKLFEFRIKFIQRKLQSITRALIKKEIE